ASCRRSHTHVPSPGAPCMKEPARRSTVPEAPDGSTLRSGHATRPAVKAAPVAEQAAPIDRLDLPIERAVPEVTRGAAALRRLVRGLTQRRVRGLVARVLGRSLRDVRAPLADAERSGLPDLAVALKAAHFPDDPGEVRPALDRLAHDELLALQLVLAQARAARGGQRAPRIAVTAEELATLEKALPFALTDDQNLANREVIADLGGELPM